MNGPNLWEVAGGIWERCGLQRDPYFIQPLTSERFELFKGQGRVAAARQLVAHVNAGGSPLLLVEGGPGLGKTSLVNYALAALDQARDFYVCPYLLEISASSTRESLAAEVLAAATSTALLAEPDGGWDRDARWREASTTVSETWRGSGFGGGINFAGFGATLSRTQVLQLARIMPWEAWKALVRNVLQAMLSKRKGLVLHLNNIDAVSDAHPEKVQQLFDEARELLILPGLQTILGASPDFRKEVIADRQRLLDVITTLGPLEQLTPSEFVEAVHARYAGCRIEGAEVVPPVADDALAGLYQDFQGDMRNTFSTARTAVINASLAAPEPGTLSQDEVLALSSPNLRNELDGLPEVEGHIVRFLLENQTSPSQGAIREATGASQPGISHATRRLEHKRWITTTRSGTRLSYQLSGYGLLYKRALERRLV